MRGLRGEIPDRALVVRVDQPEGRRERALERWRHTRETASAASFVANVR